MTTYTELEKLDAFLGLPTGTANATIADHDRNQLATMNERLAAHGLHLDDDTAITLACRPAWKALMQRLGISNAWWFDGDPGWIKPVPVPNLHD
jgi:hypothetical protein